MDFTFSLHAAWYTSTNFSTNGNQVVTLTRNCANKFVIALIGVNRAEKLRFSQHIPLQCLYTGASMSPMHVATRVLKNPRARDQVPHEYAFCQTCQPAHDFDHWDWKCQTFSAHRPNIPRDPLQRRLAWPRSNMNQQRQHVLNHLSASREAAIKWRLLHRM